MRLICGSALDVLKTLDDLSGYALVTDPPYGLGKKLHRPGYGGNVWSKLYGGGSPRWDAECVPWLTEWVDKFACAIVWGGNYYDLPPRRGWLVWDKIVRKFSSGHCELAWTTLDQPTRAFSYAHGELANEGKLHPTQKPLPLMRWCLSFLPEGMPVIDPFMGVGTTGEACVRDGRDFIGVEQDPDYFAAAKKRIAETEACRDGRGVGELFAFAEGRG